MIVKILKIVTGEELISFVSDTLDENNQKVGFTLTFPFVVLTRPTREGDELKFDVNYIAWMYSSNTVNYPIPYSSLVAMGDPSPEIEESYRQRYEEVLSAVDNR